MLYLYLALLAFTAIWVSRKEASIMGAVWVVGLFVVIGVGAEGRVAGYLFNAYQAIAGIYMAFRIHLKMHEKEENVSSIHVDEPFDFTPLDHDANDPRILSKHSIGGPDPRIKKQDS